MPHVVERLRQDVGQHPLGVAPHQRVVRVADQVLVHRAEAEPLVLDEVGHGTAVAALDVQDGGIVVVAEDDRHRSTQKRLEERGERQRRLLRHIRRGDQLCLGGIVTWGRFSRPGQPEPGTRRRTAPPRNAPIGLGLREEMDLLIEDYADLLEDYLTRVQMLDVII